MKLNDKIMTTCILSHLKTLMTACCTAIKHSNCPKMRAMITSIGNELADQQFKLFEYMNQKGFYPVENVPDQKIKSTISMHKPK